ncbi:MAG: DUF5011 domain-containing protein [Bacteroidales bacterium]|nr:DUF5011 domain-containing protein [Bacteroidales bacterium]
MKKTFLKFAGAILAIAFIGVSCTKDDVTDPEVTITGEKTVILDLGDTYEDAGATANDDKDGDLTSQITVVNPVKTDEVGTFTVVYSATDKAGNTGKAERTVIVKANKLAGTYKCDYVITGSNPDTYSSTETVGGSDLTPFNKIFFSDFSGFANLNVEATCAGKNIVINQVKNYKWFGATEPASDATIQGQSINAFTVTTGAAVSAKITELSYTIDYGGSNIDIVAATYTKQ